MQGVNTTNTRRTGLDYQEVIEKVKKYSELITKTLQPKMIVLYGSYARGTAREDSDIDIAVIYDSLGEDYWNKFHQLYKLRRNIDSRIEPVLIEQENDESGFYEDIIKSGRIANKYITITFCISKS